MNFSAIVAHDKNRLIGKDGKLPWHVSEDLKRFKEITMGHPIVMGRKTYESIGKPLPGRENVILTTDKYYKADGCFVYHKPKDIIMHYANEGEVFIIGGSQIYELFLPSIKRIYSTIIHGDYEGDTYFPKYGDGGWRKYWEQEHDKFKYESWIRLL